MEKILKIWRYAIMVLAAVLTIAMLFISSEQFHMIVNRIIIPVNVLAYLLCHFIYYKLGLGRYIHKNDNKQNLKEDL